MKETDNHLKGCRVCVNGHGVFRAKKCPVCEGRTRPLTEEEIRNMKRGQGDDKITQNEKLWLVGLYSFCFGLAVGAGLAIFGCCV